jgi:hypothetical protein
MWDHTGVGAVNRNLNPSEVEENMHTLALKDDEALAVARDKRTSNTTTFYRPIGSHLSLIGLHGTDQVPEITIRRCSVYSYCMYVPSDAAEDI